MQVASDKSDPRRRAELDATDTVVSLILGGCVKIVVNAGNKLSGFGIRVMQVPLTEVSNRVVSLHFALMGLVNETVIAKFIPQSAGYMTLRGGVDCVPLSQSEHDSRWRKSYSLLIKQLKNEMVNSAHPRYDWRRH
jgi:hypothetical protein